MAQFDRRHVLGSVLGALGAAWLRPALANDAGTRTHGLSAFGELKYPADFPHFDYVNVDAPKGGLFSQLVGAGGSTFNSLNAYIVKGDVANNMDLTFASLMTRALDEPDAVYPAGSAGPDGFFRRVALPLSAAPRDHVSRRHRHHRGRRRLLAEHAEDQGASGLFLGVARACRSRGRGPADRHLAVLAGPWARCAGAGRVDADLLGKILRRATVRRDLARGAARLRSLPRGALRAGALRRIRAGQKLVGRKSSRRARTV